MKVLNNDAVKICLICQIGEYKIFHGLGRFFTKNLSEFL